MALFWSFGVVLLLTVFETSSVFGQFGPGNGHRNVMRGLPRHHNPNPNVMGPQNRNINPAQNLMNFMNTYLDVFDPKIRIPQPPQIWQNWMQAYAPNITRISQKCPPSGQYATWNPDHMSAVHDLTTLYQGNPIFSDFS